MKLQIHFDHRKPLIIVSRYPIPISLEKISILVGLLLALCWSSSEDSIAKSYIRKTKATERLGGAPDLTKFVAVEETSTLALWSHSENRTHWRSFVDHNNNIQSVLLLAGFIRGNRCCNGSSCFYFSKGNWPKKKIKKFGFDIIFSSAISVKPKACNSTTQTQRDKLSKIREREYVEKINLRT
uniref:Uncharacterized protein n=1 Tax=Glossina pallidipes TaxID=7398 RepID=A0A1A9ZWN7_GLOPL